MKKEDLINLILDILDEASDRVWLHRKSESDYENPHLRPIIQKVLDKYDLKFGEADNFDYHFWEGVLAVTCFLAHKIDNKSELKGLMDISVLRNYGLDFGLLDT